jgi:hypothetical protein
LDDADGALLPPLLEAVTVKVYVVPLVSPLTMVPVGGGLPVRVVAGWATPETNGVTTYVLGAPPDDGAVQLTDAIAFPAVAVTAVGDPGGGGGVGTTAFEGVEAGPLPDEFAAVTVNVYVEPFARLLIVADVAGGLPVSVVVACATPPTNGVMTYDVTGPPDTGAVHVSPAEAGPAVATTFVGVPGTGGGDAVGE